LSIVVLLFLSWNTFSVQINQQLKIETLANLRHAHVVRMIPAYQIDANV